MKTFVLYHSNCFDGFGAAYAMWCKYKDTAEYIAVSHGQPVPDVGENNNIYIVDFSYSKDILNDLAEKYNKVVVIDHHKTFWENWYGYSPTPDSKVEITSDKLDIIFDMQKSGALLTWEYLYGDSSELMDYISDRDLWKFKLSGSKEFHAALSSYPKTFEVWSKLKVDQLIKEGEILLKKQDQQVDEICKQSYFDNILGFKVPVVNTSVSWSEVGNKLIELYPDASFVASYTDLACGERMFSLRSKAGFDVTTIAKQFGGGGHAQAAGFKVKRLNMVLYP